LFANYPNYTHFSNEAWYGQSNNGTFDSIESLHDSIHTIGGGQWGHLAIIAYSAFDPLFFLHHANVDRIFAMWQIINNDTYVVPTAAVYASHTQNQGDMEDIHTPLQPFFINDTTFWTSDMVRDHETFGYTYAEVANKTREGVVAAINRLYTDYSPATMALRNNPKRLPREDQIIHDRASGTQDQRHSHGPRVVAWQHQTLEHLPMNMVFKTNSEGQYYREWLTNIKVKKHAFDSSFLIYLFLGAVPVDTSSWQSADSLVGSLGVLAHKGRPIEAGYGTITGTIPLTSALMRMVVDSHVPSLDPKDIEPFLRSALELRIALLDGTMVDTKEVDGLCASIISSMVAAPSTEEEFPKWGEIESHFDLVA
jgi:tyrosinase